MHARMMHTIIAGAQGNNGFSVLLGCMAQVIARETEEADKVKSVVSQEEAVASKEAAGVKGIKVPCNSCCTIHCCVCHVVCYIIIDLCMCP